VSTQLLFEGASIEELLARVRDEHGPGARIVQADKVRTGGFAGFFARERFSILVEVDRTAAATPAAAAETHVERPVDAPGTLLELADAIDAAEAAEARVVMSTVATPASSTGLLTRPAHAVAGVTGVPALSTESPDFAAVLAAWAEPADTTPVRARRRDSDLIRRLIAVGVPVDIVEDVESQGQGDLRTRLVAAIARVLPEPPVLGLGSGDVMVIAGPGVAAYELAGSVAKGLRLDPQRVLLAAASGLGTGLHASRRISGPADARRRRGGLRRADVATIVAVDAPCDAESSVWAGDIADELGARTMWALVEATTKPGDLADHFSGLGRLDGFAVRSSAATRDPASVLRPAIDLGLPTVWLDGRTGDAEAWATLIVERVSDR
jgi:hypothetical protein